MDMCVSVRVLKCAFVCMHVCERERERERASRVMGHPSIEPIFIKFSKPLVMKTFFAYCSYKKRRSTKRFVPVRKILDEIFKEK